LTYACGGHSIVAPLSRTLTLVENPRYSRAFSHLYSGADKLNGLQLYYRLKAINRNIKILFVSALDAVPELVSILPDVKATNDIIKKPVALDDFIMAVKTALVR